MEQVVAEQEVVHSSPFEDQDNYGLDDLNSDGDTDDEDNPRKEVPKWAEGTALRTALLKQCYMPPDIDAIFAGVDMPDLSTIFHQQRKRSDSQFPSLLHKRF